MKLYGLFILMAGSTVLSPGPGVVMTLSNALRHGLRGTAGGVLGIAFGALVVAALSATSLGLLLAASPLAFMILRLCGAVYLAYLGIRLWRAQPLRLAPPAGQAPDFGKRFLEGLSLQVTNPNAIFFFLSVFPQFIEPGGGYAAQFTTLVVTYAALVVAIHSLYAAFAAKARRWLSSERGGRAVNRIGGASFIFFGAALAAAGL
jgi:threonine/homoserine/homoserine lactone efflux protein